MSDDLSQLDELIESDVLEALGQSSPDIQNSEEEVSFNEPQTITVVEETNTGDSSMEEVEENFEVNDPKDMLGSQAEAFFDAQLNGEDEENTCEEKSAESSDINISSSDIGSLSALLENLLKNKTIEITIKVKD